MRKKWILLIMLIFALLVGCREISEEKESGETVDTDMHEADPGAGEEASVGDDGSSSVVLEGEEAVYICGTKQIRRMDKDSLGVTALWESGSKKEGPADMTTADHDVNGRRLPIYCVDTEEKKIALTFDAAWGNEDTQEILSILDKHDIHVTFFMTGGWVESYPDDVKSILAAGHDLGNHSENHKNMSQLSDEEKKEEIMKVHEKVKEITGYDMFLFRPPYGDYDNAVIDVLKECGYYGIQWDVDSLDWQNKGVDSIIETVTEHKNLGNGSIVLCHNGAEYTAGALDALIDALEAEGYEIVPLSELIYRDQYHLNFEGRQIKN